jgi:hypothetical protein
MDLLMKFDDVAETPAAATGSERRTRRVLGHLVSLNGLNGVIACEMNGAEPGD